MRFHQHVVNDSSDLQAQREWAAMTNRSGPWESLPTHAEMNWRIFLTCVGVAVVIVTVVGNALTLFAISRFKRPLATLSSSVSNLYIASLAAADLVVGGFVMVWMLVYTVTLEGEWPFGAFFCDAWQLTDFVACTASLYSICAIGLDRWWSLERPLRRLAARRRRFARRIVAAIWTTPIAVWVPTLLALRMTNGPPAPGTCGLVWRPPWVVLAVSIPFLYLPVLVLIFLFFRITFLIRSHMVFLASHSNRSHGCSRANSNIFDSITPNGVSPCPSKRRISSGSILAVNRSNGNLFPPSSPCGQAELWSPGRQLSEDGRPSFRVGGAFLAPNTLLASSGSVNREKLPPVAEVSIAVSSATDASNLRPCPGSPPNGKAKKEPTLLAPLARAGDEAVSDEASLSSAASQPQSPNEARRRLGASKRVSVMSDTAFVYTRSAGRLRPPLLRAHTEQLMDVRSRSSRFSVIALREQASLRKASVSLFSELVAGSNAGQQMRAAKAAGLLLACFLLSWLPFLVLWPLRAFQPQSIPESWYRAAIWANYANSALNPLLYTLCSPRVQRTLRLACCPSRPASKPGTPAFPRR